MNSQGKTLLVLKGLLAIIAIALIASYAQNPQEFQNKLSEFLSELKENIGQASLNNYFDTNLTIHFINVGQGDAILLELPNNALVLVDAGENGKGSTVLNYLQGKGISKLQAIVGTHNHSDHIGGVDEVMQALQVQEYYYNGASCETKTCNDVMQEAKAKNITVKIAERGQNIEIAGFAIQVLNPKKPLEFDSENDNSIVLFVSFKNFQALITGDCEKECEESILGLRKDLESEVLKVGHHGSKTSSSIAFLTAVKPETAVISVGKDNSYGHPHTETLEKLSTMGIRFFRSDESGSIAITTDGNTYSIIAGAS